MPGPFAAAANDESDEGVSGGPDGAPARQQGKIRRPYAWLAAPLGAAVLVAWASRIPLASAGVAVQAPAVAGLVVGSAVLAVTPGVALLSVVARHRSLGLATGLGLLYAGAGTAAMAGLWAWYVSPAFGTATDAVLLAACLVSIAIFGRRGDLRGLGLPLALAVAVSLLYTGIAFLQTGVTIMPWLSIVHTFWHAGDNYGPLRLAVKMAAHQPLGGFLAGNWLASDRPPLQTGFTLLLWPLWSVADRAGYQFLGTVLQAAWLPALWVVFRACGVSVRRTCAAVLATAATGVVFFNTIYVWPKMLAAALAIVALAILVSRDDSDRWRGAGVLAAALATLSMLSHGGTAFALVALVPLIYQMRHRITAKAVAACAAAVAVLYLPWMAFQHFVDPPGNRLLKWMLAGVVPITSSGTLQAIIDQYRSLSLHELLSNKWINVMTLVANPTLWRTQTSDPAWTGGGFFGYARIASIYDLVPAAGPLLLGAFALLLPSARRRLAGVKPLATFTALAVVTWVVLLWGSDLIPAVIHAGAYATIVMFVGLCALAVTALPPMLAGVILAADVAWFAIEWVPGLTFHSADPKPVGLAVDWSMAVLCGCGLAAVIAIATAACLPAAKSR
jgi:hypothetical protein